MNSIRHNTAIAVFLALLIAVVGAAGWLHQQASSSALPNVSATEQWTAQVPSGMLQSGVLAPVLCGSADAQTQTTGPATTDAQAQTTESTATTPKAQHHRSTAHHSTHKRTYVRKRSTKKSAAIIGGSAAGGALIGGLAGGGKGAAIGAIVGGGGGYIYDRKTRKKRVPAESASR